MTRSTLHRVMWWAAATLVAVVAAALRLHDLENNPAGLYCDEAAQGYNAYAIGSAGLDEHGEAYPLFVWSFFGYKNPVYIYSALLSTQWFGLDAFSTRLPAALFGVAGVLGVFFVGRVIHSNRVGLFAAAFLALCPWHLHFSRIAFDMTAFAALFTAGFLALAYYAKGRRTLPWAMLCLALCLYAYQVAALFVPVFLLCFSVLYGKTLLQRRKETLLALLVIAAVVAPGLSFYYDNRAEGQQYFKSMTMLADDEAFGAQATTFARNYQSFFSPSFLFEVGDEIVRHSPRDTGELLPLQLPVGLPSPYSHLSFWLLLTGALVCLVKLGPAGKLLLAWIALYPVAPSLLNEIPTASRSFVGVPAFALLFAIGLATLVRAPERFAARRSIVWLIQGACLALVAVTAALEFRDYHDEYFAEYPEYSAPTRDGWQFGYRESIQFMESQRDRYETLILTGSDTNQAYIFPLFYRALDPGVWQTDGSGYKIARPERFSDYSLSGPVLYQLHESELFYFSDYTPLRRVVSPGGEVAFVVAEVRQRKNFLSHWLTSGPFDNAGERGLRKEHIDPLALQPHAGASRRPWRPLQLGSARVDFNRFYRRKPDWSCAYAATTLRAPASRDAFLEMNGSGDRTHVWLNGIDLTPMAVAFDALPQRTSISLRSGDNALLVKSCETTGDWHFTARITNHAGDDLREIEAIAELLRLSSSAMSDVDIAEAEARGGWTLSPNSPNSPKDEMPR